MKYILLSFFLLYHLPSFSQNNYYFPPSTSNIWETKTPESLQWNAIYIDSLYDFLGEKHSKAFIVLHEGKIVLEKYFGTFTQDSLWYWASAGKTITAFLVGKAQEEGYLSITDTTSKYLGKGWTSCPPDKEGKIAIRNQLTMTTGLETTGVDWDCTDPQCLQYRTDAGTRWFYHNAPYTLLKEVLKAATGKSASLLTYQWLSQAIGMGGTWFQAGWNNVYFSTARDMARFGLLILNEGNWNGAEIMKDKEYFHAMVSQSQDLNPAYGYLFWLNGTDKFIQPGIGIYFNGSIIPDGPPDLFAGMGKNDQKMYIVPSRDLVVIRLGEAANENVLAVSGFDNDLWLHLNKVMEPTNRIAEDMSIQTRIFPNPVDNELNIEAGAIPHRIMVYDVSGRQILEKKDTKVIPCSKLADGTYIVYIELGSGTVIKKFQKIH